MLREILESVINESEGMYSVTILGNFYDAGKYQQSTDVIFVLANSPEEAKEIANNSIDIITDVQKNKILAGGKRVLRKKDTAKIKIGASEPKLNSNTRTKKVLTKDGWIA